MIKEKNLRESQTLLEETVDSTIRAFRMGQLGRSKSSSNNDRQCGGFLSFGGTEAFSLSDLPPDAIGRRVALRFTSFVAGQMISPPEGVSPGDAPSYNLEVTKAYIMQAWGTKEFPLRMGTLLKDVSVVNLLALTGDDIGAVGSSGGYVSKAVQGYAKEIKEFEANEIANNKLSIKFPTNSADFGLNNDLDEDENEPFSLIRKMDRGYNRDLTYGIAGLPFKQRIDSINNRGTENVDSQDVDYNANENLQQSVQPLMDYGTLPSGKSLNEYITDDQRQCLAPILSFEENEQASLNSNQELISDDGNLCENNQYQESGGTSESSDQNTGICMAEAPLDDEIFQFFKNPLLPDMCDCDEEPSTENEIEPCDFDFD